MLAAAATEATPKPTPYTTTLLHYHTTILLRLYCSTILYYCSQAPPLKTPPKPPPTAPKKAGPAKAGPGAGGNSGGGGRRTT